MYTGNQEALISYLDETWLCHKQKIIQAGTKKWLHLGHTSSFRVESGHHLIKNYLHVSTGDLKTVVDRITLLLTSQHNELRTNLETARQRIPHLLIISLFCDLLGHVTLYALQLILHQRDRIKERPLPRCTESFTPTMGLPCAHQINNRLYTLSPWIRLHEVHRHWFFFP